MLAEYRRSLKHPEAEEILDVLFYRPAAYLFVRAVYRTRLTPNQVTILSLAAGLLCAWELGLGPAGSLVAAALWYALANILDCADGQLARLQQSGTPLGRIIDGIADYISSIAIFLAIGFGWAGLGPVSWPLVVAAGVSSALHAILFDRHQSEFIAHRRNEPAFAEREVKRFEEEIGQLTNAGSGRLRVLILRMYLRYLNLQSAGTAVRSVPGRTIMRLWSFLGPTTNRSALIGAALAGRIDLYLWGVVIAGNFWLALCMALQRSLPAASVEKESA